MAIVGVQSAIYGVDDLSTCERFFADFGLVAANRSDAEIDYLLPEGSHVVLRRSDDPTLPRPFAHGPGMRLVVWGVDTPDSLARLDAELSRDRRVTRGEDATIYCQDDAGLPVGFRVFERRTLTSEEEFTNAPGLARRWNKHRKWFSRATPQLIHHVVFGFPEFEKAAAFYKDRLRFRVTDVARGRGIFLRADGRSDHHNIFWAKAERPTFMHISFGVENLDELLAGANNMQRRRWNSKLGLGRHRISSTIYFYIENPAGGEAEYSADTDCLDDNWQPRIWEPLFGNQHWVADLPAFLATPPNEDVRLLADELPDLARIGDRRNASR